MKSALLALLLLAGCETTPSDRAATCAAAVKCEAGGGCVTVTRAQIIEALRQAWANGFGTGDASAVTACRGGV